MRALTWSLACVLALAGCARLEPLTVQGMEISEQDLRAIERLVVPLTTPKEGFWASGTAVVLGGNRLLTARHVLSDEPVGPVFIEVGGERLSADLPWFGTIAGARVAFEVPARGEGEDPIVRDWALIEVVSGFPDGGLRLPDAITVVFDPSRRVDPSEDVLVVGYNRRAGDGSAVGPPTVLRTLAAGAEGKALSGPILYVGVTDQPTHGMSGGAAVVWEPEARRAVVIGIVHGSTPAEYRWLVFRRDAGRGLAIRRLPPEALTGLPPPAEAGRSEFRLPGSGG